MSGVIPCQHDDILSPLYVIVYRVVHNSFTILNFRYKLCYGEKTVAHKLSYNYGHFLYIMNRSLSLLNKFRTSMELFFAIWFVMGNVWVFDSRFGSFHRAPKLHLLCIFLLAWNAISYSFPFILFVFLCCCVPLISSLLGYNMNMGSVDRGASDEQLSELPSWKYKDVGADLELGNSALKNEHQVSYKS